MLAPRDVQLMVGHLRQTAAPASVIKIHGVLRNGLADAERMDLVARNVAKAVRSASLSRTERRLKEDLERILGRRVDLVMAQAVRNPHFAASALAGAVELYAA